MDNDERTRRVPATSLRELVMRGFVSDDPRVTTPVSDDALEEVSLCEAQLYELAQQLKQHERTLRGFIEHVVEQDDNKGEDCILLNRDCVLTVTQLLKELLQ